MTASQPSAPPKQSVWAIIGKAIVGMFIGFIALPAVTLGLVLIVYALDDRCGSPGDSGGCEMGLGMLVIGASLPGAAIGLIVSLVRSLRRR